jgi:hypothetical protein
VAWAARHATDTKAADARLLLALAAADDPALRPYGSDDEPIANVHTRLLNAWTAHHHGERDVSDARAIAAVMLLHPGYPAEHRRQVLAVVAGTGVDDPELAEHALAVARSRGLTADPVPGTDSWLGAGEDALPERERLLRLVSRGFGTTDHKYLDRRMLPPALATGQVLGAARRLVAGADRVNARLPMVPGAEPPRRMRYRTEVIDALFARLWGCGPDGLDPAVWDRGFLDRESFWEAAEPLVAYLKAFGAPEFPR